MNPITFKVKYRELNKLDLSDSISTINAQTTAIQNHSTLVTLSSSQILNLFSNPVMILPAPGTGFYNVINRISQFFYAGSNPYINVNTINIVYSGFTGLANSLIAYSDAANQGTITVLTQLLQAGINGAGDSLNQSNFSSFASSLKLNLIINQPIYMLIQSSNPVGGDGYAKLLVQYQTIPYPSS